MIVKTQRHFRRRSPTWPGCVSTEEHIERVQVETWWLLGIVPLYRRETILITTL